MYVFNEDRGSIECRTLQYVANDIEGAWYEEIGSYKTFDPFYVHESRQELIRIVRGSLQKQIKEINTHLKELNRQLAKLK